jgi:membrane protein DedA with SNARE-associated domain
MENLVFIIVVLGGLLAIISGIWVAYALGRAISPARKRQKASEVLQKAEAEKP